MKIGILGGTFDPIHAGHLELARAARTQFDLEKVLFIPAANPPHKLDQPHLTPAAHRYRMVELAIKSEPGFEISNIEFARPGISYTVDTLKELRRLHPKDSLYWIVGMDTLCEIPRWRKPEQIRKWVEFIVAPRGEGDRQSPFERGVHWLKMSPCPVSASRIREQVRKGLSVPADQLAPEVAAYIERMQLYRSTS